MGYRTAANKLRTVKIETAQAETPTVKSLSFRDRVCARAEPGQFAMMWIPGVDEIPMSLSALQPDKNRVAITVEKVGKATKTLHKTKAGDTIGVRGPFGNSYKILRRRSVLIVGGGTGLASLAPLTERLVKQKSTVTLLMGAKTRRDLLFLDRMNGLLSEKKCQFMTTTEDASYGQGGLVTELAERLLDESHSFDVVYACGPEGMMYEMFLLSEKFNVPFQASLERFMRCAIGLCGTCVIGKYRVCQDGPVFSGEQLREVKDEFGHFRRGFDGRKTSLA